MHITCYCREIFSENCRRAENQTKDKGDNRSDEVTDNAESVD